MAGTDSKWMRRSKNRRFILSQSLTRSCSGSLSLAAQKTLGIWRQLSQAQAKRPWGRFRLYSAADSRICSTGALKSAVKKISNGSASSFLHRQTRLSRSEEHTSELQSLMRISYAVFCLKQKQ